MRRGERTKVFHSRANPYPSADFRSSQDQNLDHLINYHQKQAKIEIKKIFRHIHTYVMMTYGYYNVNPSYSV